ncbi:unnamed protein product [Closterium sp. NIES-53]
MFDITTPPRAVFCPLRTSHAVEPVEVADDSGAARGAEPAGAGSGGAEPERVEPGGAESGGAEPRVAESGGAEPEGAERAHVESGGAAPGGPLGALSRREPLSPHQLREWFARRWSCAAGAGGATGAGGPAATGAAGGSGATGPEGARSRGTGAAGPGGAAGAGAAGGAGAGGTTGPTATRGAGPGAAGAAGASGGPAGARAPGVGATGAAGGAGGAGGATGVGADAGGAGAVPASSGGAARPQPYFVPLLEHVLGLLPSTGPAPSLECPQPVQSESQLQPASPLPAPSPYTGPTGGLTERREPESRPASPVHAARTGRRGSRQRPPPVPGTHQIALRPSTAPQRVPLTSPPTSSLLALANPEFDSLRAAIPTVTRLLATAVTDPSFESTPASALVAEPVDFAALCRLDYVASLVAESAFVCPPSVGDIPTPRSYAEAIEGPYSSKWQTAMDAEMASWKSTGTYVDEVPPPGANIVNGMWIFRVKRLPGSAPVFKARYVARGFSQRQGVDYFQTFSPTPKMTTLRVLLHVAAQCDYELHSLDFSSAFLQGSLHEEIWLRFPPGFTGTTLAALGFAPSTADPSLFLRTDTTLPPFYILVYVDNLVFATADTARLAHVNSELQKRHTCTDLEPSGPYPELVGCLMYLMTCTRPDLAYPLSILAHYVAPGRHRPEHMDAAKRVLRYLCSTSGMGLMLGGRARVVLTGHADASWVDDLATQRSSQGYTFSLGSGSASWRSTRSSYVLGSSCEAEIYAGAMGAQELRWLTYLLTDLGEAPRSPPVLYQRGQLRLAYVATRANTADIFTKALQPCDHQCFWTMLGPIAPPCSCRLLSHQTLLWHHRLGHPSLPRLRGMHSCLFVSGLPRSLPPLPPSPAPPCLPCVEGQQRTAPHSSSFPPTTAPLQTLHMDVKGEVPDVLIPWIRAVRLQLCARFRQDLPVMRLHSDRGADKLSAHTIPFVFLGIPLDAPGWQFYHLTSRRVLPSQDVTFDESVPFYHLFPYRSAPIPPPPLFLTPAVDSGAVGGGATRGVASGGAEPAVAGPGGTEHVCTEPGVGESEGAEPGGAEDERAEPGGAGLGGAEPDRAEPRGAAPERTELGGTLSTGGTPGAFHSPPQLREWFARCTRLRSGAAGAGRSAAGGNGAPASGGIGATGPEGARTGGTGAARAGGAARVGAGGTGAEVARGTAAGAVGGTGAAGAGGAAGVRAGDPGAGDTGAGGAAPGGAGAVGAGSGHTGWSRPYFVPLLQQVLGHLSSTCLTPPLLCPPPDQSQTPLQPASPLPSPSPYTEKIGGLTERCEPVSRLALPVWAVCTGRCVPRLRLPPVPGTHHMALRPSSVPQRVPLPSPPASSLADGPDPGSDLARAASPTVPRLLATVVTDPSFESTAASALVAELVDFAAACRLDYACSLVAESESDCPPSVGGECALGTNVLEDRQEDLECFAAIVPHLVSMLIAPEGDPDAPDIPTPRSYAEEITGTYVDAVPPPKANIVDGMWILRVKRPLGSPPAFNARYVARGFSQRQGGSLHKEIWLCRPPGLIGSFHAGTQWSLWRPIYGLREAPCEWHNTQRTTLAALGFAPSTTDPSLFLRTDTSLPPFYVLVYVDDLVFATADTEALTPVKSELQKRHTCTDLGELHSYLGLQITRDKARRTITLTQSHMVQQVLQRFGFRFSSPQPTPLPTGHSLSAPPSDDSVEPSGPYPKLVGCLKYLMACTRPDLAYPLSILACCVASGRHRLELWEAAKRVLRYLCSTLGMGLVLGGRGPVVLTGHADAS